MEVAAEEKCTAGHMGHDHTCLHQYGAERNVIDIAWNRRQPTVTSGVDDARSEECMGHSTWRLSICEEPLMCLVPLGHLEDLSSQSRVGYLVTGNH